MTTTIGIDMGGTKVLAVRLEDRQVAVRNVFSTPDAAGAMIDAAEAGARSVWSEDVEAVGVGIAGLVRWPEGEFVWGPHVAGTDVSVRSELERRLATQVVVDNDANCAAWAEVHYGAGRGYENVLMVTLGTGIGGAIVIGGEIYRGGSFAGEWGHIRVEPNGNFCDCGKRGCWETVASGPALVRIARTVLTQNPDGALAHRLGGDELTGEAITRSADAGEETARALVAEVGGNLGRGLAGLTAVFDPEAIVVGGGLGSIGESLLGPARRVFADALHGGAHRVAPPILVAGLGPDAGAIGAALMAAELASGRLRLTGA